jgi:ferritin-like metal-binding protein YciE
MIGKPARAKTCEAIKGILEEGDEIMEEYDLLVSAPAVAAGRRWERIF